MDAEKAQAALDYIDRTWPELERYHPKDRDTLIGLPYPYIVPSIISDSGFTFDEMYYWDSYFIAQGLISSGKIELAKGMLENLIHLSIRFQIIPNANRFYHTSRSQQPFLTSYIFDIFDHTQDIAWLRQSITVAEQEYKNVWIATQHPNWRSVFHGLSRFYDVNVVHGLAEAESGWDTTTRFNDQCLEYIPIDLNCLLFKYEQDFSRAHELFGDEASAEKWQRRSEERAKIVNEFLWDKRKGFFFDYNFIGQYQSPVWSLAAYYSLWTGLATLDQAEALVENLEKFMESGGLATCLKLDRLHSIPGHFNQQWAHPNGWAPLHWLVVMGLDRYGYGELAEQVARTWLKTNLDYYSGHAVFREAYNVVEKEKPPKPGLYPPQLGFAWTNAVFVDLYKRFCEPR